MNRILVIDDEPFISDLIRQVLIKLGYTVETAPNGREGLRCLKNASFDLVVTDMCMPDLDGASIVRHVRGSSRPLTPVIGISGTPWLLLGADCDAVLSKPFLLQDLIDAVQRMEKISLASASTPTAFDMPLDAQTI